MKRSTEHIQTTHTGSLPQPPELADALARRDRGEADGAGLEGQVREAVRLAVDRAITWAKPRAMGEGARLATAELW